MADDETIVIRVNSAQAEAALKALGTAGIQAGKSIETIAAPTSAANLELRDLTRNIGAGISLISLMRDNLEALKPVLQKTGEAMKFAAVQGGADAETMSNLGRALDSLVHPSHIAANAIESIGIAWQKAIDAMVPASTVVPAAVRTIEESLAALAAARKKAAEGQAEALVDEQKALDDTAKAEAALEAAAVKSADARAKAEAQAAEEVIAALERERAALDAKLAQDEARLATALDKGSKLDTSTDTGDAQKNIDELKQEIRQLESQPLLSPDQLNSLDDLKNKAADAERGLKGLNRAFTVGNQDFLDEAQAADAASAAWDVYGDRLQQAQLRHEEAMRATEDADGALEDYSDTADQAAGSLSDVADAAGSVGDEAKKGTDKAKEGLAGLVEGAAEAKPLLVEIRDLLQEIVTLGSQADL